MANSSGDTGYHALVFGASGLCGWAIVDQLLKNHPARGTFTRVTGLVNRPLSIEESFWPKAGSTTSATPSFELVSNIDLTEGTIAEFTGKLKEKAPGIETVSHVFYFAYKQDDNSEIEKKANCDMLERAIGAVTTLSNRLKFVVFPTGSMAYGVYVPGGLFKAPFKESIGRLPEPYRHGLWYYDFQDYLARESGDKDWTFCDIRPDVIVGFTPNGSTFSLAAHRATYLSVYAFVEGKGAQVYYPGNDLGYTTLFTEASSEIIAKLSIWASLRPGRTGAQSFNIADTAKPATMKERWSAIAKYFGLEGVCPSHNPDQFKPGEYIKKYRHVLEDNGVKPGLVFKGAHLDMYGFWTTFDRQLSLDNVKSVGFEEELDPIESWV